MIALRHLALAGFLLAALAGGALAAPAFPPLGAAGERHPGKFIWFDLVTDDLAAAREFYGAVFGWQFRTLGAAPASYTVVEQAGRPIAGLFAHEPPPGAPRTARWLSLLSVDDPAGAARYVEQRGGSVIVPPASFPGRGTHALFRDPEGAVFGVLRSASGDPADTPVADGDFFWLDLLAREPAQAAAFYQGLAPYEASVREFGPGVTRVLLATDEYARAGIAAKPDAVKQPGWLPYILVADIGGTLEKVRASGGQVLVEPHAELLAGNLAVIADPRGGVLGLINWVQEGAGEPAP
jgi:predicted enzyme related to lactoylglutathione lyase